MSKKIFIGGLSWGINDSQLQQAFARFGTITEARVITDRATGRSRGFGFVTFQEANDALTAISEMDGKELEGRQIKVNEARDKTDGPRGGGDGYSRSSRGGSSRGGSYGGGGGHGGRGHRNRDDND